MKELEEARKAKEPKPHPGQEGAPFVGLVKRYSGVNPFGKDANVYG